MQQVQPLQQARMQQVQPSVVLSSRTARLNIFLEDPDCSLSISEDKTSLIFYSVNPELLSRIELNVRNDNGEMMSSPLIFLFTGSGRQDSVRIDSFFPLIFNDDDFIVVAPTQMLSWIGYLDPCTVHNMNVVAEYGTRLPLLPTSLTPIHSASLLVGTDTVPVSRELLSLHSPFFSTLFYGDFAEKNKKVYEIKEVMFDEFSWFIKCLSTGEWTFPSLDRALSTLAYADRYGMLQLHKRVLPYLSTAKLPEDLLQETMILAGRFPENEELINWILSQFPSHTMLLDVIQSCISNLPNATIGIALKAFKTAMEANEKGMEDDIFNFLDPRSVLVRLVGHSRDGEIVKNKPFALIMDSDNDIKRGELWSNVPVPYKKIRIDDYNLTENRGEYEGGYITLNGSDRTIKVHAHES